MVHIFVVSSLWRVASWVFTATWETRASQNTLTVSQKPDAVSNSWPASPGGTRYGDLTIGYANQKDRVRRLAQRSDHKSR
jgi:hypothetical protein